MANWYRPWKGSWTDTASHTMSRLRCSASTSSPCIRSRKRLCRRKLRRCNPGVSIKEWASGNREHFHVLGGVGAWREVSVGQQRTKTDRVGNGPTLRGGYAAAEWMIVVCD